MVLDAVIVELFVTITVGVSVWRDVSMSVRVKSFKVRQHNCGRGREAVVVVIKVVNVVAGAGGVVDATSGVRGGREGGMTCGRAVCSRVRM